MDFRIFHPILDRYGAPFLAALFVLLLILQVRRPLRRWVVGVRQRFFTNVGVAVPTFAVPTFAVLRLVLIPAEVAVAYWVAQHEIGLLHGTQPDRPDEGDRDRLVP